MLLYQHLGQWHPHIARITKPVQQQHRRSFSPESHILGAAFHLDLPRLKPIWQFKFGRRSRRAIRHDRNKKLKRPDDESSYEWNLHRGDSFAPRADHRKTRLAATTPLSWLQ